MLLRAVLVAIVAIAAVAAIGDPPASSPDASPNRVLRSERGGLPGTRPAAPARRTVALGEADGALPDRATAFAHGLPGIARLDPALLDALRRASTDAAHAGVELHVDSGWRSAAYQARLLREAVAKYGSEAQAARWVATPATSAHVSGEAVDVGPPASAAWLAAHGAGYGLCQVYGNEPWHFELRPDAVDHGCPARYPDPTHDPRMNP